MILNEAEMNARLDSEDNIVNRFRKLTDAAVVSIPSYEQVSERYNETVPSINDLVTDVDDKINQSKGISNAKTLLAMSTQKLISRLDEVDKPTDLARIASDMNKIVNGSESSKDKRTQNNIVIYRPVQNDINHYETVIAVE